MLGKIWFVALVVLGLAAFEVESASAAGGGARGSHAIGGGTAACRPGCGNLGCFPRAGNGFFGSPWAYGNAYWGWGGIGLGYEYPGWGYQLGGVPYFAQFPPVYYGSAENVPAWNTPIRPAGSGSEKSQPAAASTASASRPRQPLRIANPYYVEEQADNR